MDFTNMDPAVLAKMAWDAITQHNWFLLAALAVALLVWGINSLLAKKVPFFATDDGHAVMAFALTVVGGILTAAMGGGPFGWALVLGCLKVAMSAGGWALLKRLAMKYGGRILGMIFGPKGDATALEAAAKAAGDAAADATKAAQPKPLTASDIVNGGK